MHPLDRLSPGIKVALQMTPESTAEDFAFANQLGIDQAVLWTDEQHASPEYFQSRRERFEAHGIGVYGFGNWDVHNQDAMVLGLEGRDQKIDQYCDHLRWLAAAGIPYTTYAHMANGIWSTTPETCRGGAPARAFDLATASQGHWHGRLYDAPLTHGRTYREEELWDNFAYWVERVKPVAEETGIMIGIHPDDPPVPELGGIPRCIFGSFDGYRRAMQMADSPNIGICLCVGCWLEGGELMGRDVIETIRYFGERRKLFKVHLRNVTKPLPHFVETFPNAGYGDLYAVIEALHKVDFRGVIIADHVPLMGGDKRIGTAYSVALMQAWVARAEAEAG